MRANTIDTVALILVLIGGINWGLVGFFNFNLVASLFGTDSALSDIIYGLVGLAALWMVYVLAAKTGRLEEATA